MAQDPPPTPTASPTPTPSATPTPSPTPTPEEQARAKRDERDRKAKTVRSIYRDFESDGRIDDCDHTVRALKRARRSIEDSYKEEYPDFRDALTAAHRAPRLRQVRGAGAAAGGLQQRRDAHADRDVHAGAGRSGARAGSGRPAAVQLARLGRAAGLRRGQRRLLRRFRRGLGERRPAAVPARRGRDPGGHAVADAVGRGHAGAAAEADRHARRREPEHVRARHAARRRADRPADRRPCPRSRPSGTAASRGWATPGARPRGGARERGATSPTGCAPGVKPEGAGSGLRSVRTGAEHVHPATQSFRADRRVGKLRRQHHGADAADDHRNRTAQER